MSDRDLTTTAHDPRLYTKGCILMLGTRKSGKSTLIRSMGISADRLHIDANEIKQNIVDGINNLQNYMLNFSVMRNLKLTLKILMPRQLKKFGSVNPFN